MTHTYFVLCLLWLTVLGVTDDELHFQCFSKDEEIEKPDPRFFSAAMKAAEKHLVDPSDPLQPSQCLHIGNGRLN